MASLFCEYAVPGKTLAGNPTPREETVTLTTADDLTLEASYFPNKKPKASLLLIHMLGHDRSDWREFAGALQGRGFSALAIDLRGHGRSQNQKSGTLNWKDFAKRDFRMMLEDVDAGRRFILERQGSAHPVFIVGASIGANLALIYASQHAEVQGTVLLSPGLDYRGLQIARAMYQYQGRPILIVVSRDDEYSFVTARHLMDLARIEDKVLREYPPGAGHGTQIFGFQAAAREEPALGDLLIDWIDQKSSRVLSPA